MLTFIKQNIITKIENRKLNLFTIYNNFPWLMLQQWFFKKKSIAQCILGAVLINKSTLSLITFIYRPLSYLRYFPATLLHLNSIKVITTWSLPCYSKRTFLMTYRWLVLDHL